MESSILYGAYYFPLGEFLCKFVDGEYVEDLCESREEAQERFKDDLSPVCIIAPHIGEIKHYLNESEVVEEVRDKDRKRKSYSLFENI